MKLDKKLNKANYTETEIFFLEAWFNLCHPNALDSDRVNYLNPLNGIQELLDLYEVGEKYNAPKKRILLSQELLEIFQNDAILHKDELKQITDKLLILFKRALENDNESNPNNVKPKTLELEQKLIISLCKELIERLNSNYIRLSTKEIVDTVKLDNAKNDKQKEELYNLTNSLMSYLMTIGMTFDEFNSYYKNTLTDLTIDKRLINRLDLFSRSLNAKVSVFFLKLNIQSFKLYELFSRNKNSHIEINNCTFFNDEAQGKVNVKLKVSAISAHSAFNRAEKIIKEVIDCYAYILQNNSIKISPAFMLLNDDGSTLKKITAYEKTTNAEDDYNDNIFTTYNIMIDRILKDDNLTELRLKLLSSFRQYYNGASSLSSESRFISFWSALEALTLGVSDEKIPHDQHVLNVVLPNIGLNYYSKRLRSFKNAIIELNIYIIKAHGMNIDITNITNKELFKQLKDPVFLASLHTALNDNIYFKFKIQKFHDSIKTPSALYDNLIRHEEKVKHHVNRLYRTRNAIVHNALSYPVLNLLSLNLQHYLRSCINSVFEILEETPSMTNVSEAFLRFNFDKENAMIDLNPDHGNEKKKRNTKSTVPKVAGNDDSFIKML